MKTVEEYAKSGQVLVLINLSEVYWSSWLSALISSESDDPRQITKLAVDSMAAAPENRLILVYSDETPEGHVGGLEGWKEVRDYYAALNRYPMCDVPWGIDVDLVMDGIGDIAFDAGLDVIKARRIRPAGSKPRDVQ